MFLDEAERISTIEVVARCAKLACRRRGQTYPDGQIALELGSAHGWLGFGAGCFAPCARLSRFDGRAARSFSGGGQTVARGSFRRRSDLVFAPGGRARPRHPQARRHEGPPTTPAPAAADGKAINAEKRRKYELKQKRKQEMVETESKRSQWTAANAHFARVVCANDVEKLRRERDKDQAVGWPKEESKRGRRIVTNR